MQTELELTGKEREYLAALADGRWHSRDDLGIVSNTYGLSRMARLKRAGLIEERVVSTRKRHEYKLVQSS